MSKINSKRLEAFAKTLLLFAMLCLGLIMVLWGLDKPQDTSNHTPWQEYKEETESKTDHYEPPYVEDIQKRLQNQKWEV